jgi:16S rRNA (guanine527-N7)-methyltransferase
MSESAMLQSGISELALDVSRHAQSRLLRYLALLDKWNQVYNLTAVRETEKMVSHHLLDCLAILPHIHGQSVIDIGTGAGFPGIPLAIARADWHVTLLDTNHKKASFLRQAAMDLMLTNVTVRCERVEDIASDAQYDVVISRAFADLGEYLRLAGRLCAVNGQIAAMKGIYPFEELREIESPFALKEVIKLRVPYVAAERHLVLVSRVA